jgi:Carboxypeptidase regulatory-like domain
MYQSSCRRTGIGILLALTLLVTASAADRRSLRGVVTVEGEPAARAIVKLEDESTLMVRSFITDTQGRYHFAGLSTNSDYHVWAVRRGRRSGRKTLSRFSGAQVAIINLSLK